MSEEALQIAEKGREAKGKGEKERYTHLTAQLQRIARRDKKAFPDISAKKQRKTIEWWTVWISSQSEGFSRVFSNTTAQNHQIYGAQLSL